MSHVFVSLIFLCIASSGNSYNILGLFPHAGKSHFVAFEPLLKTLAAKGHNLTVISHFPQKKPLPRYKDVSLRGENDIYHLNFINVDDLPKSMLKYYFSHSSLISMANESCQKLHTKQMKKFVETKRDFDLILTETFHSDCFLGFVELFKVPFIGLSSLTIMSWSNTYLGNPVNPSYIPVNLLPFSDKMSFIERLVNTVNYLFNEIFFKYFIDEPGYLEAKKFFGDDLPPLNSIAKNISLLLVNTHFSLNLPRPLVPNVIEVGGMFLGKHKPLPEFLEKFVNNSPHGVIYFSMGTTIKTCTFPDKKRKAFLNFFAKIKQRVIWKWENETLPDKPENVMLQKWLPQFDILCHPNVVAYITHGGLLGITEAVHCGVPIIVIPQCADQFLNGKAVEKIGNGVLLHFTDVTEESLSQSLNFALNPSTRKKAKEMASIFQDRPLPPLDTAVYWVEYVARHRGAPHLRTAAVDMPLYQYLLLDVVAFLFLLLFILIAGLYWTIRRLLSSEVSNKKLKIN